MAKDGRSGFETIKLYRNSCDFTYQCEFYFSLTVVVGSMVMLEYPFGQAASHLSNDLSLYLHDFDRDLMVTKGIETQLSTGQTSGLFSPR